MPISNWSVFLDVAVDSVEPSSIDDTVSDSVLGAGKGISLCVEMKAMRIPVRFACIYWLNNDKLQSFEKFNFYLYRGKCISRLSTWIPATLNFKHFVMNFAKMIDRLYPSH